MDMVPVVLNADRGINNQGEVVGFTRGLATRLCSTPLATGGTLARLASPEEIKAATGDSPPPKPERKMQVRLLQDYRNNSTADDPWFGEREAMALIKRNQAIRMPAQERAPDPTPDPEPPPSRGGKRRRGALTSPARGVSESPITK